jgi:hypothetical protein
LAAEPEREAEAKSAGSAHDCNRFGHGAAV